MLFRNLLIKSAGRTTHSLSPLIRSSLVCRSLSTGNTERKGSSIEIKSIEDLAKLKSLDDVDPELIKTLINERTKELNYKNEMELLKSFSKEEKLVQESPLKKFVRPLWMFLIMSSSVYFAWHLLWGKLEYQKRESELAQETKLLESELNQLLETRKAHKTEISEGTPTSNKQKPWYKIW